MKKYIIALPLCGILIYSLLTIFPIKEYEYKKTENEEKTVVDFDNSIINTENSNSSTNEVNDVYSNNTENSIDQTTTENKTSNEKETKTTVQNISTSTTEKENISEETTIENTNIVDTTNQKETQETNDQKVTVDEKIINNIQNTNNITIIDKSNSSMCAQAIEYFYEDDNYKYYFTCIKSNNVYVVINNVEYKLADALKNGIVTIDQLENQGYKFNKVAKNYQTM